MLLTLSLMMDLIIVVFSHFHPLLVLLLAESLVFNLVLDKIVEGKDVPRVVGLGLDLTIGSRLQARLREIDSVHATA